MTLRVVVRAAPDQFSSADYETQEAQCAGDGRQAGQTVAELLLLGRGQPVQQPGQRHLVAAAVPPPRLCPVTESVPRRVCVL